MFKQPEKTLWGKVNHCDTLCPGVFMVTTSGLGGIIVSNDIAAFLSPAARKHGIKFRGHLCFEEDTEEVIVLRELLDKRLWDIPHWIDDKTAFEEQINKTLRDYHPDYWCSHEHGNMPPTQTRMIKAREAML